MTRYQTKEKMMPKKKLLLFSLLIVLVSALSIGLLVGAFLRALVVGALAPCVSSRRFSALR